MTRLFFFKPFRNAAQRNSLFSFKTRVKVILSTHSINQTGEKTMKHGLKILGLGVLALGLAACSTDTDDYEFTAPYNQSRTATHQSAAPAPAPAPMATPAPAPVMAAPACTCDCNALTQRALKAEEALQMCQESKSRVTGAFRDQLKK